MVRAFIISQCFYLPKLIQHRVHKQWQFKVIYYLSETVKLCIVTSIYIYLFILNCKLSLDLQNVRPSVRPYHYISCSFYRILSISHTGHHYNVAGVMEETFCFFRVIFGPFSALFRLKIKILWILSISHTGHRYHIASIIKRNFFMIGSFSGRFQPFLG